MKRPDPVVLGLLLYTVTALLSAALLTITGCDKDPFTYDAVTPEWGVRVATHGHHPDLEMVDAKYAAVAVCLGRDPEAYPTRFFVVDVVTAFGSFKCPPNAPSGWCVGTADLFARRIQVTEDLSALGHELAHVLAQDPGHAGVVHTCGDAVDAKYRGQP